MHGPLSQRGDQLHVRLWLPALAAVPAPPRPIGLRAPTDLGNHGLRSPPIEGCRIAAASVEWAGSTCDRMTRRAPIRMARETCPSRTLISWQPLHPCQGAWRRPELRRQTQRAAPSRWMPLRCLLVFRERPAGAATSLATTVAPSECPVALATSQGRQKPLCCEVARRWEKSLRRASERR